jgi:hypothetical protein
MPSIAIVDANILYAAADRDDRFHSSAVSLLSRSDLALVIPAMAVAEVTYLLATRLGPHAEARFLSGLRDFDVRAPEPDDWPRIAELLRQYADFPLGGTDASVIALAERMKTDIIITLDQRHFRTVRPRHCDKFRLLPE